MAESKEDDMQLAEAASHDDWAALAASRSQVYGFLGAVYNRLPDDQFAQSLSSPDLAAFLTALLETEDLPEMMREGLQLIIGFVQGAADRPLEELRTELAVERTRLLRGIKPGYGPPPPYESIYVGSAESPLTQATMAVHQAYAQAGVGLSERVREQPDFIGLELDFLRHLTEKEAQAWRDGQRSVALAWLERERAFLQEHSARWVPRFCEAMFEDAQLGFYRGIARLTGGFVFDEAHKIDEFLLWAHTAEEG